MKELIEKYYVFTLAFVVLTGALVMFRGNENLVNTIIGCFIGLISAPALLPKK